MTFVRTVFLIGLSAGISFSQSFTSLNGRVTDPSGAAVAGAVVDTHNLETAAKRSVLSDASGLYSFGQLTPGKYKLTATAPGFAVVTMDNLTLEVNTPATVPLKLTVGAVSETVSVVSEAAQVNTVDASLGNAVTTDAIIQLPFEARNPASLLALQPGVRRPHRHHRRVRLRRKRQHPPGERRLAALCPGQWRSRTTTQRPRLQLPGRL